VDRKTVREVWVATTSRKKPRMLNLPCSENETDTETVTGRVELVVAAGGLVPGEMLTTSTIDSEGVGPVTYSWQMLMADGGWQPIEGQTNDSLTITGDLGGQDVRVLAEWTDGAGNSESHTAEMALPASSEPSTGGSAASGGGDGDAGTGSGADPVSGTDTGAGASASGIELVMPAGGLAPGGLLTTAASDADGVGPVSYTWQVLAADGGWQPLEGETNDSLTITAELGGRDVRVVADWTDNAGNAESYVAGLSFPSLDGTSSSGDSSGGDGTDVGAVPGPTPDEAPAPIPLLPPASSGDGALSLGINLPSAAFGQNVPGTFGTDYMYPTSDHIDYYADRGFDNVRIAFLWERIQSEQNGPLDPVELARLDAVVDHATARGLEVVLDPHNYAFRDGALIGSDAVPNSAFADLWGKLGNHFADNPGVVFGLMNEPYEQSATEWLGSANAAITAIREAGATQLINVPGTYFDSAMSWTTSDNAAVLGEGIRDPLNNYRFEVHQYLDANASGTGADVVSETIGVERIADVTEWAEATGNKLYLGEFGVGGDAQSLAALDQMLGYMQDHANVWDGGAYWAGGPGWGDYMYSVEPDGGVDKPQMDVLSQYA